MSKKLVSGKQLFTILFLLILSMSLIFNISQINIQPVFAASLTLRPNAIGDKSECTAVGDSPNFACVDEETSDEGSTYVVSADDSTTSKTDLYNIPDTSSQVIYNVTVYARIRATHDTYKFAAYIMIKTNNTEYSSSSITLSTSYATFNYTWTTNPNTTQSWIMAEINALQIGVKIASAQYEATYYPTRCTQVYAVVTFDAPPVFNGLLEAGNTNEEAFGPDTESHYYRNGTKQTENWIYIKVNITDDIGVSKVFCEWYNGTWRNMTMTSQGNGIYDLNVTGQNYSACTFNIHANDTNNNWMTKYVWKFYDYQTSWGTEEQWRKYVALGQTPETFGYQILYLHSYNYATIQKRVLPHEQRSAGTLDDTGVMNSSLITSDNERYCYGFTVFFYDNSIAINPTTIDNIYLHIWWMTQPDQVQFYYNDFDNYYDTDVGNSKQNITGLSGFAWWDHYALECKLWDIPNPTVSDNTVNLFSFGSIGTLNSIISTPLYPSWILLNVPDNATLKTLDSDGDFISDYSELYETFSNPFVSYEVVSLIEGYSTGDDVNLVLSYNYRFWLGQSFIPTVTFNITSVRLKLCAGGYVDGFVMVGINTLSSEGYTGTELTTDAIECVYLTDNPAGAWYRFNFSVITLYAGERYIITVRTNSTGPTPNCAVWRSDSTSPKYLRGSLWQSDNQGEYPDGWMWYESAGYDMLFEVYGILYSPWGPDTVKPWFSNIIISTTQIGKPCTFSVTWFDTLALTPNGGYIFGSDVGPYFTNDTFKSFISNPQTITVVKVLPENVRTVTWRVWARDNQGNWNDTGLQSFKTTITGLPENVTVVGFDLSMIRAYVAAALNIPEFAAGMLLSAVLSVILIMVSVIIVSKCGGKGDAIMFTVVFVGLTTCALCTALTWLPVWLLILIGVLTALMFGSAVKKMVAGGGGD